MKQTNFFLLLGSLLYCGAHATAACNFESVPFVVDCAQSTFKWTGKKVNGSHWGNVKFSQGVIHAENGTVKLATIIMDMNSIEDKDLEPAKGGSKLSGHLKSEDFFHVEKYPTAKLVITSVNPTADGNMTCVAYLTIKEITNEITFPATSSLTDSELIAVASFKIDRTKWGIKYGSSSFFENLGNKAIHDDFEVDINIVAVKEVKNVKSVKKMSRKQPKHPDYAAPKPESSAETNLKPAEVVQNTPSVSIANEKRLALVIGNANYGGGSALRNPVNDANLMAMTLQNLGFEVLKITDADKRTMEQAIRNFSKKLPNYNVGLFYYAGHGILVNGSNYLIPTDAALREREDCKYEAIPLNFMVEEFEKYPNNINIVILDACRDNPFRSWSRGDERGLKAIPPASGTIISFATSEGAKAADGNSNNGTYTAVLVQQMAIPQSIEAVFKRTRIEVEKLTNGAQSPQEWSKLKGDFYFKK